MKEYKDKHHKLLYPTVRVRVGNAGGSGTVIYSELIPGMESSCETYILTNCHVVLGAIKVEKKWSGLLERDVKRQVTSEVMVDFFDYDYGSREAGTNSIKADIVAYNADMDLALLKLKTIKKVSHVANLFPRNEETNIRMFAPVVTIGASLGHQPIHTIGEITCFTDVINNLPYWMVNSPIIFGNSGGAAYLLETLQLIGVPSKVAIINTGFMQSPISHMAFLIPITTIYQFLEDYYFQFIYDSSYTSFKCEKLRQQAKKRDEIIVAAAELKGDEDKEDEGVDMPNAPSEDVEGVRSMGIIRWRRWNPLGASSVEKTLEDVGQSWRGY